MTMSVFFDIPEVLQIVLLTEWLMWRDNWRFDSAVNHVRIRYQSEFQRLISSENCIFSKLEISIDSNPSLRWFIDRGIKLRSVEFDNVDLKGGCAALYQFGSALIHLSIHFTSESCLASLMMKALEHCPNVACLSLCGSFDGNCPPLPPQLQSLTLDLSCISNIRQVLSHNWMCGICAVANLTDLFVSNLQYIPIQNPLVENRNIKALRCSHVHICSISPNTTSLRIHITNASNIVTLVHQCRRLRCVELSYLHYYLHYHANMHYS